MLDREDTIALLAARGLFLRPGRRWKDAADALDRYKDSKDDEATILLREGVCVRRVEWSKSEPSE